MGLEFSSANLNNQMWEQKKKKNEHPLQPSHHHNSIPQASTPTSGLISVPSCQVLT